MTEIITPVATKQGDIPVLTFTRSKERVAELAGVKHHDCSDSTKAAAVASALIVHEPVEHYIVLCLDSQFRLIVASTISQGTVSDVLVHQREAFAAAVAVRASYVVFCHNHPSGAPKPSSEDRSVAKALDKAGMALGIPVIDHLIVHHNGFHSFHHYHATRSTEKNTDE